MSPYSPKAQKIDPSEWEHLRKRLVLKDLTDEEISRLIEKFVLRQYHLPNAYSVEELRTLRSILRFPTKGSTWIPEWHRQTNEFALMVGAKCQLDRLGPPTKRASQLQKQVLVPVKKLTASIRNPKIENELNYPWGDFKTNGLLDQLARLEFAVSERLSELERPSIKGKTSEDYLKDYHVYVVDCLCEYFNEKIEPTRMRSKPEPSPFEEAVELLGKANFPPGTTFSGAIKSYVRHWTAVIRRAKKLHAEGKFKEHIDNLPDPFQE
jgi:hypothetical protein